MKSIALIRLAMVLLSFSFVSCNGLKGDDALASLLFNNRMVVILKGTYATDAPLGWAEINNDVLFSDADDPLDKIGLPTYSNLPIFLDVGEIRVSTKGYLDTTLYDVNTQTKADKFWDNLAPSRQVYCRNFVLSADRACTELGGLDLFNEIFNGNGATYPSTDVGAGTYQHVGVFVRSFFTGYARQSSAFYSEPEYKYIGYRSSYTLAYDPAVDAATEAALPSQLFPLHHTTHPGMQNSMTITGAYLPLGIEIRFNIKENLMLHSSGVLPLAPSGDNMTYVGISDWRRAHNEERFQGGNILTRARIFYPDFSRSVRVSGGSYNVRSYYAIYYHNECIDSLGSHTCNPDVDLLPLAATPVRTGNDNKMTYLMPGDYKIQCRYDTVRDGYPETVLSEQRFTLPAGIGEYNIHCNCGTGTASDDCN